MQMGRFIEVELTDGEKILVSTSKILAVKRDGNHTVIYCQGNFPNDIQMVWTINMEYEKLKNLLK